jgi:hypothetical protein
MRPMAVRMWNSVAAQMRGLPLTRAVADQFVEIVGVHGLGVPGHTTPTTHRERRIST